MAFAFVSAAHADNTGVTSLTCDKPTGTTQNDLMLAYVTRKGFNTDPSVVPGGWTQAAKQVDASTYTRWVYWKVAGASEGASYTFEWAADASRIGISIATYRDGFDTADPIDVVSSTEYLTDNTTIRAASMTVTAANSPIIFTGGAHFTATESFDVMPSAPTALTEDVDYFNDTSREVRGFASAVWSGSGATGNMDATISATNILKAGFALALNPAAGGSFQSAWARNSNQVIQ